MNNSPVSLTFDITNDNSPIKVGMDVKKNSITDTTKTPKRLIFKIPQDTCPRVMTIYESGDSSISIRLRLMVTTVLRTTLGMLGRTPPLATTRPMTLVKRIHAATKALVSEIIRICKVTELMKGGVEKAIKKVHAQCKVCTKSGEPIPSKNISISHVNKALNEEVQGDFMFVRIRQTTYTVIHYVDTGTGYSEDTVVIDRKGTTII